MNRLRILIYMHNTIIEPYKAAVGHSYSDFISDAQKILSGEPVESIKVIRLTSELNNFSKGSELSSYIMDSFLADNLKDGREISEQGFTVFQNYGTSFTSFDARGSIPLRYPPREVYRDVPYQFIFGNNKGGFLANLGFEPIQGGILVSQIQGVKHAAYVLGDLKWSRMLLSITEEWAYQFDIPRVCVLPSNRNKWGMVQGHKSGMLIYDVTAKRMGYDYDSKREVYIKRLNTQKITDDFVPQSCK